MDLVFIPLLLVAMWFLLIRPQQARLKAQRNLISSLSAGDRVVTAGGLIGTITVLGDEEVHLELSPGVEALILRGAISRRLDADRGTDEDIDTEETQGDVSNMEEPDDDREQRS